MEKQYSNLYHETKLQFENAAKAFDKKPNTKTATDLSKLRSQFTSMSTEQMFTKEYYDFRNDQLKSYREQYVSDLKNLMQSVSIESNFERGNF